MQFLNEIWNFLQQVFNILGYVLAGITIVSLLVSGFAFKVWSYMPTAYRSSDNARRGKK